MSLRPPAVAGSFYPADKLHLEKMINECLADARIEKRSVKKIKALISPHAGYIYSGSVAAAGFLLASQFNYQTAIIIGPSHRASFTGLALSSASLWQTPLGRVQLDSLNQSLTKIDGCQILDQAHNYEHSVEVQLPFLQKLFSEIKIVPITAGNITDHRQLAGNLNEFVQSETLVIASSDLSHYLSYQTAREVDQKTIEKILALDSNIDYERACGADPIKIIIELARLNHWQPQLLDYRNSGDTAGDKQRVVGYVSIIFV